MEDSLIYDVFDSGGKLAQTLDGFEFRESQMAMASDVMHLFKSLGTGAIEAGTGIGKSLAYLVPAMDCANKNPKERTVIATSTINLQNQLVQKDIPLVSRVMESRCKVELAVGRNNYLCIRRLYDVIDANILLAQDGVSQISQLEAFSRTTETGLRTDFKGKLDPALWAQVNSDGDFCMNSRCPYFRDCFYFRAKRKLQDASIIICNHHLLFLDAHTRSVEGIPYDEDNVLPAYSHLVIDEAHNIERHATDLFSDMFSSYSLKREMERIYNPRNASGQVNILEKLAPECQDKDLYEEVLNFFSLVSAKAETFNLSLISWLDYNRMAHRLIEKQDGATFASQFKTEQQELLEAVERLCAKLTQFSKKCLIQDPDDFRLSELSVHTQRISEKGKFLKDWFDIAKWKEEVHFIESERHGNNRYALVETAPLQVSDKLQEALFSQVGSVVCTSATLNLNDDFKYWSSSIGLPVKNREYLRRVYSSPFDYKNRLMLLTPYDAPEFARDKVEEYATFLCDTVYKAVSSAGGGSLVLFTSFSLMDTVYNSLRPMFEALGLCCMKQGDEDRYSLLEHFKEDRDSILFATDSFWEGVDAPGDTLRLVIITKLPFRMPDEPIYKARLKKLESEGKSGFQALQLPDATMRLKQGFGRLMRHTSDKGIVLILDSRVVSKNYGSWMLSSLPDSYHPECSMAGISDKIESFLY